MIPKFLFFSSSLFGLFLFACQSAPPSHSQEPDQPVSNEFEVIAYYAGGQEAVDAYDLSSLTQIIYSFCHLQGNELAVDNAKDSLTIRHLVSLKSRYPKLKVLLSLGGWGGCKTCSEVFNTEAGRLEFASSVKRLSDTYGTDGLDLDWEYPGIEGYPGHQYLAEDKANFTALVQALRESLGAEAEISFAAAGFPHFFDNSVEWDVVMPLVNRVNLMTYDLVSGFSTQTGHHTPLYSTDQQTRSTDLAIQYLDSFGVPREKMVIGAAFYARVWKEVENVNQGLYQKGVFEKAFSYQRFDTELSSDAGYEMYWDEQAEAPYAFSASEGRFATFDDSLSVSKKTTYAQKQKLGGIMFWELTNDSPQDGLLQAIANELD